MEFAQKRKELEKLTQLLSEASDVQVTDAKGDEPTPPSGSGDAPAKSKTSGRRRNLRELEMLEERCEVHDPALEGNAIVIGFDDSVKIGYRRGAFVRFIIARAKYKQVDDAGEVTFPTPESPKTLFPKTMAAPTLMAHVICERALKAVPFCRQEESFTRDGFPLDRGTMSRWNEDVGMTLGPIVQAMLHEAMSTAFCLWNRLPDAPESTLGCLGIGPRVPWNGPSGHLGIRLRVPWNGPSGHLGTGPRVRLESPPGHVGIRMHRHVHREAQPGHHASFLALGRSMAARGSRILTS